MYGERADGEQHVAPRGLVAGARRLGVVRARGAGARHKHFVAERVPKANDDGGGAEQRRHPGGGLQPRALAPRQRFCQRAQRARERHVRRVAHRLRKAQQQRLRVVQHVEARVLVVKQRAKHCARAEHGRHLLDKHRGRRGGAGGAGGPGRC